MLLVLKVGGGSALCVQSYHSMRLLPALPARAHAHTHTYIPHPPPPSASHVILTDVCSAFPFRFRFPLGTGSVVLIEITNSGRAARGERWDFTSYKSKIKMCRPSGLPLDLSLREVPLQPPAVTDEDDDDDDDGAPPRTWAEQENVATFFRESTNLQQASRGTANWGFDLAGVFLDSFGTVRVHMPALGYIKCPCVFSL